MCILFKYIVDLNTTNGEILNRDGRIMWSSWEYAQASTKNRYIIFIEPPIDAYKRSNGLGLFPSFNMMNN